MKTPRRRSGTSSPADGVRSTLRAVLIGTALYPAAAAAQDKPTPADAVQSPPPAAETAATPPAATSRYPRVFLDCQGNLPCDRNHFRTEIQFVNWALDREDSDVHVIATSEEVGGGGRHITLDFIGRGEMGELTDQLTYTTSGSDVFTETRDGVTKILSLGLMRYALETGMVESFELDFEDPEADGGPNGDGAGDAAAQNDPWNHWTFRVGLSGDLDLRETSTDIEFNPSFSAERITENWKVGLGASVNAERSRRELSGGREVRDDRDEWELETQIVRSVSNHVSFGFTFDGESSVSENQKARFEVAPAIEYNYFPYSMSNRRQLIVQYSGGVQYSDYNEETIFRVTNEVLPQHELDIRYNAREAWGNAGFGVGYSQYLHDTGLYRADVNGDLSVRVTRGLDLNFFGGASWVNDEIHIPLSEISDEDILLGRINLPSSYQYSGGVGLSYRWGSPFTNVVNTRFSGGGGGGGGGGFRD